MPVIDKPKEWRKKVLLIFRDHAKERGWAKEHATRNLAHFLFGKSDELTIENYVEDNKQQVEAVIYKKSSTLLGWPELFDEIEAYVEHYERSKYLSARDVDNLGVLVDALESMYGPVNKESYELLSSDLEHNCFILFDDFECQKLIEKYINQIAVSEFADYDQDKLSLMTKYGDFFDRKAKEKHVEMVRVLSKKISVQKWKDFLNLGVSDVVLKLDAHSEGYLKVFIYLKYRVDKVSDSKIKNYNFMLFSGVLGTFKKSSWGVLVSHGFREPLFVECKTKLPYWEFSLHFLNDSEVFYKGVNQFFLKKINVIPRGEKFMPRYFIDAVSR